MDVAALSLLVEIIDAGNLSRAASKLGMTRANVSKRLNQFERSLGAELLKRSTRHIEPTELGLQLYAHGKNIQHEVMAAQESVQTRGAQLQGRVRLSVPSGYGQHTMAPWFIEFMGCYPGVTLEVIFDNDIEDLGRGSLDFALLVAEEVPKHLISQHCATVDYVACASPEWVAQHGDVSTLAELKKRPLITSGMTAENLRLAAQTQADQRRLHVHSRLISANFFFLRDAILQGMGAGLVPRYMVQHELESQQLVQLSLPVHDLAFLRSNLYQVYVPGRFQSQAQTCLMQFLLEKIRQHHQT